MQTLPPLVLSHSGGGLSFWNRHGARLNGTVYFCIARPIRLTHLGASLQTATLGWIAADAFWRNWLAEIVKLEFPYAVPQINGGPQPNHHAVAIDGVIAAALWAQMFGRSVVRALKPS